MPLEEFKVAPEMSQEFHCSLKHSHAAAHLAQQEDKDKEHQPDQNTANGMTLLPPV